MLQGKLEARSSIIQIGMFNQTCGRVLRGDVEELSSTLFELLLSHVEMIFVAIAQLLEDVLRKRRRPRSRFHLRSFAKHDCPVTQPENEERRYTRG